MPRLLPTSAVLALAAYYVYFAGISLRAGLSHDDLMNAHRAVIAPWPSLIKDCLFFFLPSDQYRPVGAVFYRICRDLFGFHPLPLHIGMLVLWAAGLALVYDSVRRLADSTEVALLTVLLMAHHSNRPFYYYNSGFCYDVLCHLFYFAALAYYLRVRAGEGRPGEKELVVLSALYLLALGSKEMAVSLPVVLGAYEWLRPWRDWRFPSITAVMAGVFVLGRVLARDGLSNIDGYRITLRPAFYLESWTEWLASMLFLSPTAIPWTMAAAFLAGSIALAWLSCDRAFRIAVVLALAGVLPVAFIRPVRGLEAICIPMTGVALMAAWWVSRLSLVVNSRWRGPAVFALALVLLADLHARKLPPAEVMMSEGAEIAHVQRELEAHGRLAPRSRVLFVEDPFPEPYGLATTFLLQILNGASVQVTRADKLTTAPDWTEYDYVLSWQKHRIVSLKTGETASRGSVVPQ